MPAREMRAHSAAIIAKDVDGPQEPQDAPLKFRMRHEVTKTAALAISTESIGLSSLTRGVEFRSKGDNTLQTWNGNRAGVGGRIQQEAARWATWVHVANWTDSSR